MSTKIQDNLAALADELVSEIRNVKDLTKENLPLVAKEYVAYQKTVAVFDTIVMGSILIVSAIGISRVLGVEQFKSFDFFIAGSSVVGSVAGFFGTVCSAQEYLSFKMQPRLKAIEGVVKLFKGKT